MSSDSDASSVVNVEIKMYKNENFSCFAIILQKYQYQRDRLHVDSECMLLVFLACYLLPVC